MTSEILYNGIFVIIAAIGSTIIGVCLNRFFKKNDSAKNAFSQLPIDVQYKKRFDRLSRTKEISNKMSNCLVLVMLGSVVMYLSLIPVFKYADIIDSSMEEIGGSSLLCAILLYALTSLYWLFFVIHILSSSKLRKIEKLLRDNIE